MSSYAETQLYKTLVSYEERYKMLSNLLETETENKAIIKINKELSHIEEIVKEFQNYKREITNIDECLQIIKEEKNQELIKMAQEELEASKKNTELLEANLQKLLLPKDPLDEKNVMVEMRAAVGGDESSIFVENLFNVYKRYSDKNKWRLSIIDLNENSTGIYFLTFSLTGEQVYSKMKFESGVHRVQRVPETESKGRVHTSTITVSVMPEQDEIEVNIDPGDLRIDVYRASGAGGQHVNKTESSVRITHLPTGIIVACQQERSQIQNRAFAMKMLRSKLWELKQEEVNKTISETIRKQIGGGWRSEKIRTYNYPQNRITDHRANLTINRLSEIMENGNLNEIHEVLANKKAEDDLLKLFNS